MSRIGSWLARVSRRATRAYHLACAREDALRHGLRVPVGAWICQHCRLVVWERDAFVRHLRACAA